MPSDHISSSQRFATELRAYANEHRRMAETACIADNRNSLLWLADQIDAEAVLREAAINQLLS